MNKTSFSELLYIKGRIGWQRLSKEEYLSEGDYYLVTGVDINNYNRIDFNQCYYVSKERYEMDESIQLKEGDIIVTKDGTIGKIGIIDKLNKPATLNSHLFLIRNIRPDILDTGYLFYVLKSDYFQKFALNHTSGSNIPAFTQESISKFELVLPSLFEQKKVSDCLSFIEEKIRNNTKINTELEALAKTIYDYWFLQFDFPNEEGKPYKSSGGKMVWNDELKRAIPEGWEVKAVSKIIEVKDGTHDSPKYTDKGKYLITSKHLTNSGIDFKSANFITEEDFSAINQRSQVDTGDILFSMIGAVGTVYRIDEEHIDFAIKNVALYKTSQDSLFFNYLYMTLKSELMDAYIANTMAGSIQKFMSLGSLRTMPIIYDAKVIEKYQKHTKDIFSQMTNIKRENQELISLRDFLLPMLMNGQVTFK